VNEEAANSSFYFCASLCSNPVGSLSGSCMLRMKAVACRLSDASNWPEQVLNVEAFGRAKANGRHVCIMRVVLHDYMSPCKTGVFCYAYCVLTGSGKDCRVNTQLTAIK
jgi:hypothetical protein